jgi:drug/metabolite transporter (DMT)-like permease
MAWILGGQILVTPDQLPGSLMALLSMVCCAFYLSFGRKHRESGNILLFSVPVYAAAAAAQALFALVLDGGVFAGSGHTTWIALAALAVIPTVGGHTLTLTLLRRTTAHTVALSVPAQFVLNTIVAVPLFGERPDAWFYPGAALVTAGVLLAILSTPAAARPSETNR